MAIAHIPNATLNKMKPIKSNNSEQNYCLSTEKKSNKWPYKKKFFFF